MATLKELRQAHRATGLALQAAEDELAVKRQAALEAYERLTALELAAINDEDVADADIEVAQAAVRSARTDLAAVRRVLKPREVDDPVMDA